MQETRIWGDYLYELCLELEWISKTMSTAKEYALEQVWCNNLCTHETRFFIFAHCQLCHLSFGF